MRLFALGSLVVVLAACAPARVKQVATKPAPSLAATCTSSTAIFVVDGVIQPGTCIATSPVPASALSASCPLYIVDGVIVSPTCEAPKKPDAPKCDSSAALFVIDGIVQGTPCAKPESRDSVGYFVSRKSH
jgi:hypothetical protein